MKDVALTIVPALLQRTGRKVPILRGSNEGIQIPYVHDPWSPRRYCGAVGGGACVLRRWVWRRIDRIVKGSVLTEGS